jgi:uncharacterized membrane protein YdjX (TVP38/TMEM64 family)
MDALGRRHLLWLVVGAVVLLGAACLAQRAGLVDLMDPNNPARFRAWVESFGPWAPLMFIGAYVLAAMLFVPWFSLTVLGGIAFGPIWGTALCSVAATISATLDFVAARYALRNTAARWVARSPHLRRLDTGLVEHGWRILLVSRLIPFFPSGVAHGAYGLSSIRLVTFVLVSWVCLIPATAAYTLAAGSLVDGTRDPVRMLLWLGGAAVIVVAISLVPRWLPRRPTR